jgi:putative DNA primase/helicase
MTTSTFPISPIDATVNALRSQLVACPPEHAFFQKSDIDTALGSVVAYGELADVDCTGNFIRALRNGSGSVENAVMYRVNDKGQLEQVFIPGALHLGHFTRYGEFASKMIVTLDDATAALIHSSTGETVVAALYPDNLEAVCEEILLHRPDTKITIAVDYKMGDLSQDSRLVRHAMAIAGQHDMKLAFSGATRTFVELQRASGSEAIAKQIEFAKVPETDADEADIPESPGALALPTATAQNGSSLMFDLVAAVRRHTVLPEVDSILIALWVVFTHLYHLFGIAPSLAVTSPEKRCGKTNLMIFLSRLCRAPYATSNMSEAAIYRRIEKEKPTLLMDEAETFMTKSKTMIGILNSGYKRTMGGVERVGKNGLEKMTTFCPKAIAMIGEMPETLKDRSIHIRLERKSPDEKVETVPEQGPDELSLLCSRLVRWVADNSNAVARVKPEALGLNNDRAEDNAKPLLAIAAIMGGNWLERAQGAFEAHAEAEDKTLSHGEWLLTDTARAFAHRASSQLLTADLLDFLYAQEEAPWRTFNHGRAMTARDLAGMFKQFGISSIQMRHGSGQEKVGRGYQREQFTQVFARYVKAKVAP